MCLRVSFKRKINKKMIVDVVLIYLLFLPNGFFKHMLKEENFHSTLLSSNRHDNTQDLDAN
jgi:hypothetical protein